MVLTILVKREGKKMRLFCLLGALMTGLALGAAELPWVPLTGTDRTPAASAELALQVPFTSWWYGHFVSGTIEFTSERSGLWLLIK